MSAREFKFGDLIPKPIYGRQYIFVRYMPHIDPPAIELICDKPECLWMTEEELAPYLEPSAQPHVAAGSGWKTKMFRLISYYADVCGENGKEGTVWTVEERNRVEGLIGQALAEVVEMPEPAKNVHRDDYSPRIFHVDGPNGECWPVAESELLPLAAALIRTATSSDPSA